MKVCYCDCFSGVSGDMFLAALIDAGAPVAHIQERLDALGLPERVTLTTADVRKHGLRATDLTVGVAGDHMPQVRRLGAIVALIEGSRLSEQIQATSKAVFTLLAQAEARVHGVDVEQVHFHEVGALDSIADIVGAAIALDYLGIERLYSSALPYGAGQVKTQHGILPLPAPATLEIARLAHIPLVPTTAEKELVTPTGAAILGALATFEQPEMTVHAVGIGAGKRDLPWANIVRLMIGESAGHKHAMILLETNIDDMNPQIYAHVMSRLFAAGALDVFLQPIYMKKNRPGNVLSVIARQADEEELARIILTETTTLGLRVQPMRRHEADRRMTTVTTAYGDVPVKLKILDGRVIQAAPEHDVCAALASSLGVTLATVYRAAQAAAERAEALDILPQRE